MLFRAPDSLDAVTLESIKRIGETRKNLAYALSGTLRWTGLVRRLATAQAVRGSVGIEGYRVSVGDAIAAVEGIEPTETSADNWSATLAYQQAMTYVLQLADDPHFSYDEGLIRALHFMVMQYKPEKRPGKWRPGGIRVTEARTGVVVYEAPDVEQVPGLISELVASLRGADPAPPLVRAAMAHLNLTMIHPFADGNGRMARCLQTLVLVREGILDKHFCSIEEYLGRHTAEYYAVLAGIGRGQWSPHSDTADWIRFNVLAHARQAVFFKKQVEDMRMLWDRLETVLKERGLPERMLLALADAAIRPSIRNSTYRTSADISETLASRDLKQLVKAGLLEAHGQARGRTYTASESIRAIWRELASNIPEPLKDF